jgi:predicted nucleic acid-binding protein
VIILDSNVFIYLANGTLDRRVIKDEDIAHASITKIESLGFTRIYANELLLLEILFGESYNLPLTDDIVEQAIKLRQTKNMSLGDAIIAATALEHDYELWTANAEDFDHIDGLHLRNPLKS